VLLLSGMKVDKLLVIELHHTHLCFWLQPTLRLGVSAALIMLARPPGIFTRKGMKSRENFGLQSLSVGPVREASASTRTRPLRIWPQRCEIRADSRPMALGPVLVALVADPSVY
jgi:hypothetical protein